MNEYVFFAMFIKRESISVYIYNYIYLYIYVFILTYFIDLPDLQLTPKCRCWVWRSVGCMAGTRAKSVAGSSREWPLWTCSVAGWCRGSDTWEGWLFSGKSMEGFQVGGWTASKKKGGVETVLVLLVFFWWKLLLHPISHETNVEINPQQRAKVVQYVFKGQASDIQLGDQKVNLNHLVDRPPF